MEDTALFNKIYGSLAGAAIGDAMGGPVEGSAWVKIAATHGRLTEFLPYGNEGDYHANWGTAPGTITDDTRLRNVLVRCIVEGGRAPSRGDFARAITEAYYAAPDGRAMGFWEEYHLKGIYDDEMRIWGGQSVNGNVMMIGPVGLLFPCDPESAFRAAVEVGYLSEGYSVTASGIAAAAVASAMAPDATVEGVVESALAASARWRVSGPRMKEWQHHREIGQPVEIAVEKAVALARKPNRDIWSVRQPLYDALPLPTFSDSAHTVAVALAMFVAAEGDPRESIIGAVNYGRDCDSYASVAGSIAGAFRGAPPAEWIKTVEEANPNLDLKWQAARITEVVAARHAAQKSRVEAVEKLLKG